ncbi:MAG: nuclease [Roseovarius sp.]|nr:nuclease [Roseovarius sp.]MBK43724.1 nuclease [Roseovarius sp.]MBK43774.1 nuclease [Roseovarius sp.]MBK43825.1 nuclease [Roseovarius sp.]|tara:strand:- start:10242 stop:11309 length:1068 start_codon:yes stop_codon:yes gene_type:complete
MAKRKRLGGPLQDYLGTSEEAAPPPVASAAPIARVAGDASLNAAFEEVSRELSAARSEGRLVQRLSLDRIEAAWLIRDRSHPGTGEDPDFAALLESLRRFGQRTPIEVVDLGQGRYGLISGWRRLTALTRLRDETGEARFDTVLAFLRQPASSEEAYVSMVEENEIRLGLSYYERARIAAKSVEAGVFDTPRAALQALFASASRAKRSKIGSFLTLYEALGDAVRFPQALTERLGLALVRIIEADDSAGSRLRAHLEQSETDTVEAEQSLIAGFIEKESPPAPTASSEVSGPPATAPDGSERSVQKVESVSDTAKEVCPGLYLTEKGGSLRLSGPAIGPAFRARLEAWLRGLAEE